MVSVVPAEAASGALSEHGGPYQLSPAALVRPEAKRCRDADGRRRRQGSFREQETNPLRIHMSQTE